MADSVQPGDKVSWNWNGSHPSGTAAEVKSGDVTVTSHRGNDITKTGTKNDPAVHIERSGNDVVKTVSELKVEQKGASQKEDGTWDSSNGKADGKVEDKPAQKGASSRNGHKEEAQTGDKRKAEEEPPAKEKEQEKAPTEKGEPAAKKQKAANGAAAEVDKKEDNKKKPGRPKGSNGPKKEKKVPRTGVATRKTRSQGKAE